MNFDDFVTRSADTGHEGVGPRRGADVPRESTLHGGSHGNRNIKAVSVPAKYRVWSSRTWLAGSGYVQRTVGSERSK